MPTVDKHLYTEELPNLKFVGKDKPHAARRIARRPWEADKYLWSVFTLWVWGKRSFAALIEYSVEFRNWFQDNIAKCVSPRPSTRDPKRCQNRKLSEAPTLSARGMSCVYRWL